ncbi:hypothetical protein ROZALSC1DRAFT_29906, partial [Rozella allomycis CSF55]
MDFKALLERSKSLSSQLAQPSILPCIDRNLEQIDSQTRRLFSEQTFPSDANAYYLLSQRGFNPEPLENDLKSLPTLAMDVEPTPTVADTDVVGFIKQQRQNLVISILEEQKCKSKERAKKIYQDAVKAHWEKIKKKTISSLPPKSGMKVASTSGQFSSSLNEFSLIVKEYVKEINEGNVGYQFWPRLLNVLKKVAFNEQMVDCFELLFMINKESDKLKACKTFLEKQMFRFIEKMVQRQPREANVGGSPSVIDKVRFNEWDPQLTIVNNVPIFALVFYLIRCGFWTEALNVSMQYKDFIERKDVHLISFLKAYMDDKVNPSMKQMINSEFSRKHPNDDRFKVAIYKILGQCEVEKKNIAGVIQSREDYLWLQKNIRDFGPKHFNANHNQLNYFSVLALSLQIELALGYLFAETNYCSEAVHCFIALSGTLNLNDSVSSEIVEEKNGNYLLNPVQMIFTFIKNNQLPLNLAIPYVIFLFNTEKKTYYKSLYSLLRDLVIESKEFAFYLGSVKPDGNRMPGYLEDYSRFIKLSSKKEYNKEIIVPIANHLISVNQFEESLHLFNLAEEYDKVMDLLNKNLSNSISNPNEQITLMAQQILSYYQSQGKPVSLEKTKSCETLLKLFQFFSLYRNQKYEQAQNVIEDLKIIPTDQSQIHSSSVQFDELLSVHIPEL